MIAILPAVVVIVVAFYPAVVVIVVAFYPAVVVIVVAFYPAVPAPAHSFASKHNALSRGSQVKLDATHLLSPFDFFFLHLLQARVE